MKKWLCVLLSCLLLTSFGAANAETAGAPDLLATGDEYLAAGDFTRALTAYELALEIAPGDTAALLRLATAYARAGRMEEALASVGVVLSSNPLSGEAYRVRAVVQTLSAPAQAWQDALRADVLGCPLTAEEYAALANALEQAGLRDEAAQAGQLRLAASGEPAPEATVALQPANDTRALDAAFDQGALTLTDYTVLDPDTGATLIVPEEGKASMQTMYGARMTVNEAGETTVALDPTLTANLLHDATFLSVSPAGDSFVFLSGGQIWLFRNREVRRFEYAPDRGVANSNGNLENALRRLCNNGKEEGAVWSPDGRYFVLTSMRDALMNANYEMDLILFDTQSAQYFLAATYGNQPRDGMGVVIQACFDETGRYVYYGLYGNLYSGRFTLLRYDLTSGQSEVCYDGAELAAYSRLCRTPDGALVNLQDDTRANVPNALNVYRATASGWQNTPVVSAIARSEARLRRLDLSPVSGKGVALYLVRQGQTEVSMLTCLDAQDGFAGVNRLTLIDSLAATQAHAEPYSADLSGALGCQVVNAQLSPDGEYALLLLFDGNSYVLKMLRLATLELRDVATPFTPGVYAGYGNALSMRFAQGFAWPSPDIILMNTESGVRCLTFTPSLSSAPQTAPAPTDVPAPAATETPQTEPARRLVVKH